uniref:Uncharacterized protein n=1 Tax=Fagus sylvatica TaxID=28930 RepID=A0A2N9FDM3_FAGSY
MKQSAKPSLAEILECLVAKCSKLRPSPAAVLLGFLLKHGGGLGLPAIRWWWLIRPGRERPTPRSRPGRERPTPRPGLAVPDPNGLEVTRADLGLDERDPRHGLGRSPSPIPLPVWRLFPLRIRSGGGVGGSSLGHHRRWVVV